MVTSHMLVMMPAASLHTSSAAFTIAISNPNRLLPAFIIPSSSLHLRTNPSLKPFFFRKQSSTPSSSRPSLPCCCRASSLKALVFDCDGVILESEDLHRRAYNAAFSHFQIVCPGLGSDKPLEWTSEFYDKFQNQIGGGKPKMRWSNFLSSCSNLCFLFYGKNMELMGYIYALYCFSPLLSLSD
mgnify:FL=1